jgi:hypothetical protein
MGKKLDLVGSQFGRLTVVRRARRGWLCRCACGVEKIIRTGHLISGSVVSCGCFHREQQLASVTVHGAAAGRKTREYVIWLGIKQRCHGHHVTSQMKKNYRDRGIVMCSRWRSSFASFLSDMGPCPASMTIERKDNDGNYEPSNCVWASRTAQNRNKRNNVRITFDGRTACLPEWSEITGINEETLRSRLTRGWPIERALKSMVAAVILAMLLAANLSPCYAQNFRIADQVYLPSAIHIGQWATDVTLTNETDDPVRVSVLYVQANSSPVPMEKHDAFMLTPRENRDIPDVLGVLGFGGMGQLIFNGCLDASLSGSTHRWVRIAPKAHPVPR